MKELTKAEETLLLAILKLKQDAYGVAIKRQIQKVTGKSIPYGTLYFILSQLKNKGLVNRFEGESKPERGGRNRVHYTLTARGNRALQMAYETQQRVWEGFSELNTGEKFSL